MRIRKSKKGQNTVEYLLVVGLVLGVIIAAATTFKTHTQCAYDQVNTKMSEGIGNLGY